MVAGNCRNSAWTVYGRALRLAPGNPFSYRSYGEHYPLAVKTPILCALSRRAASVAMVRGLRGGFGSRIEITGPGRFRPRLWKAHGYGTAIPYVVR